MVIEDVYKTRSIYLTLYQILDSYKKEMSELDSTQKQDSESDSEKNKPLRKNLGAMKYLQGIFAGELVVPVRKKISDEYVSNFFFYEILNIHPNFEKAHVSATELQPYLFGIRDKCKSSYNFETLKKCFVGYQENGASEVKMQVLDRESGTRDYFEAGWMSFDFTYVDLDMKFILNKISQELLRYMRQKEECL